MSPPAQKAFSPAPLISITRGASTGFFCHSLSFEAIRLHISVSTALRALGLLRMNSNTWGVCDLKMTFGSGAGVLNDLAANWRLS